MLATSSETLSLRTRSTKDAKVLRAMEETYSVTREYEHSDRLSIQYCPHGPWFRTTVRVGASPRLVTEWETLTGSLRAASIATGHDAAYQIPDTVEADKRVRTELASYAELADNWDGQGAKRPPQKTIRDALSFLDRRPDDIPLPDPEQGSEGEVGVYWDDADTGIFAEVTFEGDGTYAYFAVRGTPVDVGEKYGGDGFEVAAPWPADMVRLLRLRSSA